MRQNLRESYTGSENLSLHQKVVNFVTMFVETMRNCVGFAGSHRKAKQLVYGSKLSIKLLQMRDQQVLKIFWFALN